VKLPDLERPETDDDNWRKSIATLQLRTFTPESVEAKSSWRGLVLVPERTTADGCPSNPPVALKENQLWMSIRLFVEFQFSAE